ncbi:MAG TPA: DUF1570 domain-containing protein [Planctomycetota bacterium]|nr:DUF1570 domain-containing protein [Planctomycetota bacterium]
MNPASTAILLILTLAALPQDPSIEAANARVKAAREELAKEGAEEKARDGRIEKALQDSTAKAPLRVKLAENLVIDQVKVASYAAGRVKLVWPQGSVEYPLELLPQETRGPLLNGILATCTPRDQFEVGRLLLRSGDYDRAELCFGKCVLLEPSLKPLTPDVSRLRALSRLFEGQFRASGNQLQVSWNFRKADEAKDFSATKGSLRVQPESGLEFTGEKNAFALVKDIPFQDRVKVSALPKDVPTGGHLLGVRFNRPDGTEVLIYAVVSTKLRLFLAYKSEKEEVTELVQPGTCRAGDRMELELNRGKFTFRVGSRSLWSGNEGGFTDVAVLFGGIALEKADGGKQVALAFRDAIVSGNVSPQWMRKKTADFREMLQSELARERRVTLQAGQEHAFATSVDGRLDAAVKGDYDQLRALLGKAWKSGDEADEKPARDALVRFIKANPGLAQGWFWRGVLEEWAGNSREALKSFDLALARLADFPEALCGKARMLIKAGETKVSRELVEKALTLRPDLGEAHLLRGRLDYEAGKPAIDAVALARKLAADDPECQLRAQELLNVLRGPLWPRVNKSETAHYTLRSDLPAGRCREMIDHIEAMRSLYEETLGLPSGEGRKSDLLVFNAPEGFYQYMDTTSGGRSESVLGYFNPWYGQMVLYEDPEPDETLRVIAHEGFHQYLHGVLMSAPIWFNEGMAEYVGAAKVERGKVIEKVRLQEGRLLDLKLALKYGWQPESFSKIMVEPKSEFYGDKAAFKYAQAWSMIHFFMNAEKGRWKDRMAAYAKRLFAGDSAEEAYAAVFAKENVAELEALWLSYVKNLGQPLPAPPGSGAVAAAGSGALDLMKMVDLKLDVVEGEWAFGSGKLACGKKQWTRLQFPMIPPEEYDLTIVATRVEGADALLIGLVYPNSQFLLVVDGWKGTTTGLALLDGRTADNNETTVKKEMFRNGKSATIVVSVRKGSVSATIDGKSFLDWKGQPTQLGLQGEMRTPNPKALAIGGWDAKYVFSKIQLTTISGEGKKLR